MLPHRPGAAAHARRDQREFLQIGPKYYRPVGNELDKPPVQQGATCWFVAFLSLLYYLKIIDDIIERCRLFLDDAGLDYDKDNIVFYYDEYHAGRKVFKTDTEYTLYGPAWQRIIMAYIFYHWEDSIRLAEPLGHIHYDFIIGKLKDILRIRTLIKGDTKHVSDYFDYDGLERYLVICTGIKNPPCFLINLKNYIDRSGHRITHEVVGFYQGVEHDDHLGTYLLFWIYDQAGGEKKHFALFKKGRRQMSQIEGRSASVKEEIQISMLTHYYR